VNRHNQFQPHKSIGVALLFLTALVLSGAPLPVRAEQGQGLAPRMNNAAFLQPRTINYIRVTSIDLNSTVEGQPGIRIGYILDTTGIVKTLVRVKAEFFWSKTSQPIRCSPEGPYCGVAGTVYAAQDFVSGNIYESRRFGWLSIPKSAFSRYQTGGVYFYLFAFVPSNTAIRQGVSQPRGFDLQYVGAKR
jgi:hypothetical protein